MGSRGHSGTSSGGNAAPEQLYTLCRHILLQDVEATDGSQLSLALKERVKDNFHTSKSLLTKSQSAQEDTTLNEFSLAEKIKKYLVS